MSTFDKYKNFVRASEEPSQHDTPVFPRHYISGIDAQRFYVDVYSQPGTAPLPATPSASKTRKNIANSTEQLIQNDKQLFLAAQNDDYKPLEKYLTLYPDKINILDEYGWSLLMVACQANSVKTVQALLDLGINTYIRDRAGNSANSLVIKQKNVKLIDTLLNNRTKLKEQGLKEKTKQKEHYDCPECHKTYEDKTEHLSSTIHNINASKGKKIMPWYGIPESNRGFQILVRSGWNKEDGLGPDGTGKKYPIKPVMKEDRKGLGTAKRKCSDQVDTSIVRPENNKKRLQLEKRHSKAMEINFRREFYDISY